MRLKKYWKQQCMEDMLLLSGLLVKHIINSLVGRKEVYTLAIPKGDTHDWENQVIEFWDKTWKSFGSPLEGIESNIPLAWNKKVTVERYE